MTTVNNLQFGDTADAWVRATEERMLAVFQESTKRVFSLAANGVPVDTGFARASVRASLQSIPQIDPNATNKTRDTVVFNPSEVVSVIAIAKLGDIIYIGWTAAYAEALEYGHSQQAPSGFVRIAALQWPQIVSAVASEAKAGAAINRGLG